MSEPSTAFSIARITADDAHRVADLMAVFSVAFDMDAEYAAEPTDAAYLRNALSDPKTIVLIAELGASNRCVGGMVAYELQKLERRRSEIYVYDLAVAADARRQGIATALLAEIRRIAHQRGAHVVFVQADRDDPPAIALYESLGRREDVLHFDLTPLSERG